MKRQVMPLFALLGLAGFGASSLAAGTGGELLVVHAGIGAYKQAVEGLRAGLSDASSKLSVTVVDLSDKNSTKLLTQQLNSPLLRAVVAVGPEALSVLASGTGKVPLLSTLLLESDSTRKLPQSAHPVTSLSLDIPLEAVLKELRLAFPDKSRIGILRNPRKSGPTTIALEQAARRAGFTLLVVDCPQPEQLVESFVSLKNRVDFVWCLPDGDLYNATTVRALLIASIGNQLPIIGFSESFVQAGAVLGLYPDFVLAGRQTADLVRRYLSGSPVPAREQLKTARVSLNLRVARLLGLRPSDGYPADSHLLNLSAAP